MRQSVMKFLVTCSLVICILFTGCGKGQKERKGNMQRLEVEYEMEVSHILKPKNESTPMLLVNSRLVVPDEVEVVGNLNLSLTFKEQKVSLSAKIEGARKASGFTFYKCESGIEFFKDAADNAKPLVTQKDVDQFKKTDIEARVKQYLEKPNLTDVFFLWKYSFDKNLREYLAGFKNKIDEDKLKEIDFLNSFYHPMVDNLLKNLSTSKTESLAKEAKKALKGRGL